MTISCLPWHQLPETEGVQDILLGGSRQAPPTSWFAASAGTADTGGSVQSLLADPRLIFGQCCGYDLIYGFSGTVGYSATPCHSAPGCQGGTYTSLILVRQDVGFDNISALRGRTAVINDFNSHSGANVLRSVVAPFSRKGRFFSQVNVSGGHVRSLSTLLDGRADVMAMDCVLRALLLRHRPGALDGFRIIGQSAPVPDPPFVTSAAMPADTIKRIREGLGYSSRRLVRPSNVQSFAQIDILLVSRLPASASASVPAQGIS